ncbi:MAG TPA: substrate-binding domain-containing protein [Stellaceae bacterium]|nr:substrate-binding domain-containing protein [Stellaceae bacterium]
MPHERADGVDGIRLLSAGAVESIIDALGRRFEAECGIRLHVTIARSRVVKQRASAGTDADIVITARAAIDELRAEGAVLADGIATLALSSIGVAVRSGSPIPELRSTADFIRLLRNALSVAYADPETGSPSGRYFTALLARLGLTDTVTPKAVVVGPGQRGTVVVAEAVADGRAEIGIQQIAEILHVAGVVVAGPLPAELQMVTAFTAAVTSNAQRPEQARQFIRFATSAAMQPIVTAHGMAAPPEPARAGRSGSAAGDRNTT